MTTETLHNQASSATPTETYETYHRVAQVVGEVVHESYLELLTQLANPWILASLDFSEPEIAAFFKLLSSTKITIEFTNPVEDQRTVSNFNHTLKPKLLSLIEANLQPCQIAIAGEVKV